MHLFEAMRDHFPRIAGAALLAVSLLLLLLSPGSNNFSPAYFLLFLVCLVSGVLLATGLIGTHPEAARLRRQAMHAGLSRSGPLCNIAEHLYPFAPASKLRHLVVILCATMGLCLGASGLWLLWAVPAGFKDRLFVAVPLLTSSILCLWLSIRYPGMYLKVTPKGVTVKSLFRTATMRWESILALVAREHHAWTIGGFVSTGITYTLYSERDKLQFTSLIQGSNIVALLVSQATGLPWDANSAEQGRQ